LVVEVLKSRRSSLTGKIQLLVYFGEIRLVVFRCAVLMSEEVEYFLYFSCLFDCLLSTRYSDDAWKKVVGGEATTRKNWHASCEQKAVKGNQRGQWPQSGVGVRRSQENR
jgi:hypothetical protein